MRVQKIKAKGAIESSTKRPHDKCEIVGGSDDERSCRVLIYGGRGSLLGSRNIDPLSLRVQK